MFTRQIGQADYKTSLKNRTKITKKGRKEKSMCFSCRGALFNSINSFIGLTYHLLDSGGLRQGELEDLVFFEA